MSRTQANVLLMAAAALWGLQTIAQRYTPATLTAVIVSAKGTFGAAAALVLLGERISLLALLGAALMLAAIVHPAFGRAARDATNRSATGRKWSCPRLKRARIVNSTSR